MEWYSIFFSLRPLAVILIKSSLAVPWKHPLTSLMVFFSLFSCSLVYLEYLYKSWVDKWYDHCYILICLITLCVRPFLPNHFKCLHSIFKCLLSLWHWFGSRQPLFICVMEVCIYCRYEEMMTENVRSLTDKYQDLEDSYSKLLYS